MTRYIIDKNKVSAALQSITAAQAKKNIFRNVTVKPYAGRKYDPVAVVVIKIG